MNFTNCCFENVWIQFKKWRLLQAKHQLAGEHVTLSLGTDKSGWYLYQVQISTQLYCLHYDELPF